MTKGNRNAHETPRWRNPSTKEKGFRKRTEAKRIARYGEKMRPNKGNISGPGNS